MREYETTIIIQPEISDEARATLLEKFENLIEREGAQKLMWDDWGKRKLAYEIQDFQKGHYLTLVYADQGKAVAPLERALRLEESVLRFLTIVANDEIEDLDARRTDAAEKEQKQRERAEAERVARAEEERARREAEASAQAAQASRDDRDGEGAGEPTQSDRSETAPERDASGDDEGKEDA